MTIRSLYLENTLVYDPAACNGCARCVEVCPHAVFEMDGRKAILAFPQRCMECGACVKNCPTRALSVTPGVGCAAYIIQKWIKGKTKGAGAGCCC